VAPERTILGSRLLGWDDRIGSLERLMVGGRTVVEQDHAVSVDEHELTQSAVRAHRALLARASTVTCKEGTAS
jgi:hypothetical protein